MRDLAPMWDAWDLADGKFFGEFKANSRVTVEPDWELNLSPTVVGANNKGPFRWFQRQDESQVEIEIPNVKSVSIDRGLDSDAATCTIVLHNQWHEDLGEQPELPGQLGMPGYFTFNRGKNPDAVARWNQQVNDWSEVLVENALLRTYQGYGGYDDDDKKISLEDSIDGGYTPITGLWLVDRVQITSHAQITLTCRDMTKLLLDQTLYKPLVPTAHYPLKYYRWVYSQANKNFDPRQPITVGSVTEFTPAYFTSGVDVWYGPNYRLHGHAGMDSIDGNPETFALSVGNIHPSREFCADWWDYAVHQQINEVYIHPWGGNYTMYVSIFENGSWVDPGHGLVPYSQGTAAKSTGADVPFVMQVGVPWEQGGWYQLPRIFNAERIRITFRDHTQSPWGPYYYRCGIREIKCKVNTLGTLPRFPWTTAAAGVPGGEGYWIVDEVGKVFPFGDAQEFAKNWPNRGITSWVEEIGAHPDGDGYWIMESCGRVHAHGSAVWHGDMAGDGPGFPQGTFIDFAVTHTGNGYMLLSREGGVHCYGDAQWFGNMPVTENVVWSGAHYGIHWPDYVARGLAAHPDNYGYWIANGNGEVRAFGAADDYGQVPDLREGLINPPNGTEWISCITPTQSGNGYWLLSICGKVWAFGDATHYGQGLDHPGEGATVPELFQQFTWKLIPNQAETGYYFLEGGGTTKMFGDVEFWGGVGSGQTRVPGNYKDYTDIVKEILLWSGFWLYDGLAAGQQPAIFGNIESTGAYADEPLPEDMFDKVPPMDAINKLKEIVGYQFWMDQEGGVRFESPNWWASGNFFYDGTHTDFIPEIDERMQLIDYGITATDEPLRSEIIIANGNPDANNTKTTVTRLYPDNGRSLRGMVKPVIWGNEALLNPDEQRIMAELIALQIWFKRRVGSVTCVANPALDIGDQVRIWERQTSESYVHYVRGISTNHDLDSGVYTMTLDTNWLGDDDEWVITRDTLR